MTETVQGFYSMLAQVWRDGVLDISITRPILALGVFLFFCSLARAIYPLCIAPP